MFLIDAHGSDHGLSVEVERRQVTIRQWAEYDEPDEDGSYSPHIQMATVDLATLLDSTAVHMKHSGNPPSVHKGMRDRVVDAALAWLSYWGGEEERVDDGDRPCQHFGSYWGRRVPKDMTVATWIERLTCAECGAQPTDLRLCEEHEDCRRNLDIAHDCARRAP
jgi:hypothetical protein